MTTKPIIFGSHLGNFANPSDPLWLGWRKDDGRIDLAICDNDLREAANAGANATRLFKPTFELVVGDNLWDVGSFNAAEFEDTRSVIALCRKYNIMPWLTLEKSSNIECAASLRMATASSGSGSAIGFFIQAAPAAWGGGRR